MITTFNILVYTIWESEVIFFPIAAGSGTSELDSYKNFLILFRPILWFVSPPPPPFFLVTDYCDFVFGHLFNTVIWWHQAVYLEILHSPLHLPHHYACLYKMIWDESIGNVGLYNLRWDFMIVCKCRTRYQDVFSCWAYVILWRNWLISNISLPVRCPSTPLVFDFGGSEKLVISISHSSFRMRRSCHGGIMATRLQLWRIGLF